MTNDWAGEPSNRFLYVPRVREKKQKEHFPKLKENHALTHKKTYVTICKKFSERQITKEGAGEREREMTQRKRERERKVCLWRKGFSECVSLPLIFFPVENQFLRGDKYVTHFPG